jgi:hypothetical protein
MLKGVKNKGTYLQLFFYFVFRNDIYTQANL